MRRVFLLLLPFALTACGSVAVQEDPDDGANVADHAGIPLRRINYFPPPTEQPRIACDYGRGLKSQPIIDEFENRWFSQQLAAAEEPSLYIAAKQQGQARLLAFRFTWLRSFHAPVFIRIEEAEDGKFRLRAKELSGAGGYDPGTIKRRVDREMRPEEVRQFLMAKTLLAHLPPKRCDMGCDGAEWIFETVDGQGYQVIMRWSPEDGPVREVGKFMMRLPGWTFADIY